MMQKWFHCWMCTRNGAIPNESQLTTLGGIDSMPTDIFPNGKCQHKNCIVRILFPYTVRTPHWMNELALNDYCVCMFVSATCVVTRANTFRIIWCNTCNTAQRSKQVIVVCQRHTPSTKIDTTRTHNSDMLRAEPPNWLQINNAFAQNRAELS